eukprot:GSMAST32.ASY1.ANO1.2161.1 assembled CDS
MDWDVGNVFSSDQALRTFNQNDDDAEMQPVKARNKYREFIRNFHVGSVFIYRDQLLQNERPATFLPQFELAAKDLVKALRPATDDTSEIHDIQITLKSKQDPLIKVPGIVISANKTRPKALAVHIKCRGCNQSRTLQCGASFQQVQLPRNCDHKCVYVDQQTLKLQEAPEVVPTGEMPRHVLLTVDRSLSNRLAPGVRICVIGISSIINSGAGNKLGSGSIRTPYIKVVGLQRELNFVPNDFFYEKKNIFLQYVTWTPEEEEKFIAMSRDPNVYDKICRSISPAISGEYTVDIKKAVAALLFGGSRKSLPDGDINVLLLGDPSTAKSQFLKFVEKAAPIRKGSSAAGLTASVVRDSRGDFYLEGGYIFFFVVNFFDKMREQDRVAIHEAMEQQTISVAKAGITTILNSRNKSVLAAANPVYGRYDDDRSAAENIDFLPTILSRFDLIFIVRDIQDENRDMSIARHVMGVHINAGTQSRGKVEGEIDLDTMTKYVHINVLLACLQKPVKFYVLITYMYIRASARARSADEVSTIPITVRQLEAIVRISESLAKMTLSNEATVEHVSIRLFKVSTLHAAQSGSLIGESGLKDGVQVQAVEDQLKRRVAIGANISVKRVVEEFQRQGHSEYSIRKAIHVMVNRGDMAHRQQRKHLRRMR